MSGAHEYLTKTDEMFAGWPVFKVKSCVTNTFNSTAACTAVFSKIHQGGMPCHAFLLGGQRLYDDTDWLFSDIKSFDNPLFYEEMFDRDTSPWRGTLEKYMVGWIRNRDRINGVYLDNLVKDHSAISRNPLVQVLTMTRYPRENQTVPPTYEAYRKEGFDPLQSLLLAHSAQLIDGQVSVFNRGGHIALPSCPLFYVSYPQLREGPRINERYNFTNLFSRNPVPTKGEWWHIATTDDAAVNRSIEAVSNMIRWATTNPTSVTRRFKKYAANYGLDLEPPVCSWENWIKYLKDNEKGWYHDQDVHAFL